MLDQNVKSLVEPHVSSPLVRRMRLAAGIIISAFPEGTLRDVKVIGVCSLRRTMTKFRSFYPIRLAAIA
jgi:hypothetical protein